MLISGIHAAGLERQGTGTLTVEGRSVVFVQCDGLCVAWECQTQRDAWDILSIFRSAAAEDASLH